nr:MAG TPA: hypothetical protein [Caudoviricetes sp.]
MPLLDETFFTSTYSELSASEKSEDIITVQVQYLINGGGCNRKYAL